MITPKNTLAVEFVEDFLDYREQMDFNEAVNTALAQYPAAKYDAPGDSIPMRIVFTDTSVAVLKLVDPDDSGTATMVVGE